MYFKKSSVAATNSAQTSSCHSDGNNLAFWILIVYFYLDFLQQMQWEKAIHYKDPINEETVGSFDLA